MKIKSLRAHAVNLPFHHPVSDSLGTYHSSNHGIVIIESESGHYGAGEIALAWFGGTHSLCREINDLWRPLFEGEDCRNINFLMEKLNHYLQFSKRHLLAKAGIETALWDLLGKTLGTPVYNILGGKMRDCVKLTGGINMESIDKMVETAKLKVSEGYKELKIKVGLHAANDLMAIRQIRNSIPDEVLIRADVNMAWKNVKHAKRMIDEYWEYGVHMIEQPLAIDRLDDLAWLKSNVKALILLDESVWDAADAQKCLDAGAADLLHVYSSESGGLLEARRIFELAALHQATCTIGSMPEARLGASASLHLGISMINLSDFASDIRGYTVYRDDVVHEDLILRDGCLYASEQPGLGVTVDFEKLKSLSVEL